MNKPNLLFPTPVWTLHLENYENCKQEMYTFVKRVQAKIKKE